MINSILCATDGSHVSAKAVSFACALARTLEVPLTFISVNIAQASSDPRTRVWDAEIMRLGDEQVERELHAAYREAKEQGVPQVSCVTVHSRDISQAIVGYAEENHIGHIVAGSTGRTGLARLLIGSVASAIVARAHCPVTIVR
jgi:nucleotide-binding universal stress UspA family protein